MIFPAVILEPVILEGQSPDRNGGDRIRRYRIIVVYLLDDGRRLNRRRLFCIIIGGGLHWEKAEI